MTHASPAEHGSPAPTPSTMPFSEAEWQDMRTDDRKAGAAIVGLMTAIFVAGLIGYLWICFWVA